ncbi:MAG TPA: hypothetical protein VFE58_09055 [Tepidisphaeraceae bacterium]|jgi:hypothetical protein|nr:hypothetical protein [Tepidisphaeraceae bacterium]
MVETENPPPLPSKADQFLNGPRTSSPSRLVAFLAPVGFDSADEQSKILANVRDWQRWRRHGYVEAFDINAFCLLLKAHGLDRPPGNLYCPWCENHVNPYDPAVIITGSQFYHSICVDEMASTPPLTDEMIAAHAEESRRRWLQQSTEGLPDGSPVLV